MTKCTQHMIHIHNSGTENYHAQKNNLKKQQQKKTLKPLGTDVYTIENGWIFINTGSNKLITQLTHTQTEFSLTEAKKLVIISS